MPRRAGRTRRWWRARLHFAMADSAQLIVHQKPALPSKFATIRFAQTPAASPKPALHAMGLGATTPVQKATLRWTMTTKIRTLGTIGGVWTPLSTSIVPFFNKSLTPADPLEASIPAQATTWANDNCIEAMVFGNVLDAEGQAALGLGSNLDMWIRQDPTHAATFPWGTQQWNGVSGTNSEFVVSKTTGPIANTTRMTAATANTGCVTNGYCNARRSPSTIQQAVIPTRTATTATRINREYNHARTCKSSSLKLGRPRRTLFIEAIGSPSRLWRLRFMTLITTACR